MSSPKLIIVLGATGNQGGSVARRFLQAGFRVRGICRDISTEPAVKLASLGAEMVSANLDNLETLIPAFAGANIIFSVTQYWEPFFAGRAKAAELGITCRRYAYDVEFQQGKNIVDAAATTIDTLDPNGFLVSTLSHAGKCSNGSRKELYHFDAKADVYPYYVEEKYPELAKKMSCIQTGYFYTSFRILPQSWLFKRPDGVVEMATTTKADRVVPHLIPSEDMGNFTYAVYQMPPGKNYMAAGAVCSWSDWMATWGRVTGLPAIYREVSAKEFIDSPNDEMLGQELEDMFTYNNEPGYDGGMDLLYAEDLIKAGIDCPMTSLEDWMKRYDWSEWIYQIEGSVDVDGRGPSIWDTFCATEGKIADGSSGAVACDSYKQASSDVALLKSLGAKCYRFSISWSRVIPLGGRNDPINKIGLDFYVRFVDELLAAGITPFVTLYHWDLPDALDKRYGGLLNRTEFPLDFEHYAQLMFKALPKVKHWITFNEPWCSAILGYSIGLNAPGRTSDRTKSPVGDSAREPWIVGHNILVAHGRAVRAYRAISTATSATDTSPTSRGIIGITLNGDFAYPWDPENPMDHIAATRRLEFSMAWFADPIYFGAYPESMQEQLGSRLPEFTSEERELVLGSNDFYGMNHYTSNYAKHKDGLAPDWDFVGHMDLNFWNKAGDCIGDETQSAWLRPCARGFRDLLVWLSKRYNNPTIYVTENGTSVKNENDLAIKDMVNDEFRVRYFNDYIHAMAEACEKDGVNIKGYMGWSLMDNFEWADGYQIRFGVVAVDYKDNQKRYPKKSAKAMKPLFESLIKSTP
ncbi:Beta-glucosidase 1B [Ceratocystis fimbriata CBS 114723]|uniref:beta-glucosidase n=1 Tax=Ceratocystis fimbriata CBS 114723 TaxID=1035309 RepID=A0A2C5X4C0_9PEZI|nr:Beta-glucosidase 1B [Ceratocystis fimbriata CBS 114723]